MTQSSTSLKVEDRDVEDLLLLPAFHFRLLRCFSLLRHCCPPSHDEWRCRNRAVANRPALQSDYTSTREKTLFPLHRAYMTASPARPTRARNFLPRHRACWRARIRSVARKMTELAEPHIPSAFLRSRVASDLFCVARRDVCTHDAQHRARPQCDEFARGKIIFHRGSQIRRDNVESNKFEQIASD